MQHQASPQRYERAVPRYTSYPTAAQFHAGVDGSIYGEWLRTLPGGQPIALYAHVPFCRSICWYCACHTRVARQLSQIEAYAGLLERELDLLAADLGEGRKLMAMQLGGGTPTELGGKALLRIVNHVMSRFTPVSDVEISIETDPRYVTPDLVDILAAAGVTRVSIGVQDFDPAVQRGINRIQPEAMTADCMRMLRTAGIERINVDLVYGLPHQTLGTLAATLATTVRLRPSRVAVFGYAHVPWMAKRQRAIDEAALPDTGQRHAMACLVAEILTKAGYRQIGLDHYALPGDPLAIAADTGRLRRNFQGYTDIQADTFIGIGATAISSLPGGLAQNTGALDAYEAAIRDRRYATARGVHMTSNDLLVADVIERLMCEFEADLPHIARRHGMPEDIFDDDVRRLQSFADEGLIALQDGRLRVTEAGRLAVRLICAAFDHHLPTSDARHSRAI
ncbi:oxygen-independent coproporphyrinogen III oxidase [Vineibacter terrae]|uniref:Coproporphyrinogen-III oxidase n=1 Tax=Vineibacter terrae TaxID=2586908 RepID=A0A5C8PCR8_9HYPH|nr:oxygen-independent coproporphyrinogen III oxidase [Vineibacter terrae]TXL71606.1 oxygen-independent coproporphyrinogen III oxidase [Vineibacter terrae]